MNIQTGVVPLEAFAKNGCMAIIHGGAGPADPGGEQAEAARKSLLKVLATISGQSSKLSYMSTELLQISPAERLALHAVQLLEKDPLFNAGRGAALQADGQARVSASYMESTRRKFSSVANVAKIMHPSELAYYLQSQTFSSLDGDGAQRLAARLRIPKSNLVTARQWQRWQETQVEIVNSGQEAKLGAGTVGCVSIDTDGRLAVITSTGGVGNETAGRLGDTPTTAGNYCSETAGISCTGIGEQILDEAFASKTVTRAADGMPIEKALKKGLVEASQREYHLAAIGLALDKDHALVRWIAGTTEQHFTWGIQLPEGPLTSYEKT